MVGEVPRCLTVKTAVHNTQEPGMLTRPEVYEAKGHNVEAVAEAKCYEAEAKVD